MKNYNRAVLGTGIIANETAAAMLKNGRNLFAVGNRTYDKAVAFAEKYNIGKVYDSYDKMFTDRCRYNLHHHSAQHALWLYKEHIMKNYNWAVLGQRLIPISETTRQNKIS